MAAEHARTAPRDGFALLRLGDRRLASGRRADRRLSACGRRVRSLAPSCAPAPSWVGLRAGELQDSRRLGRATLNANVSFGSAPAVTLPQESSALLHRVLQRGQSVIGHSRPWPSRPERGSVAVICTRRRAGQIRRSTPQSHSGCRSVRRWLKANRSGSGRIFRKSGL